MDLDVVIHLIELDEDPLRLIGCVAVLCQVVDGIRLDFHLQNLRVLIGPVLDDVVSEVVDRELGTFAATLSLRYGLDLDNVVVEESQLLFVTLKRLLVQLLGHLEFLDEVFFVVVCHALLGVNHQDAILVVTVSTA